MEKNRNSLIWLFLALAILLFISRFFAFMRGIFLLTGMLAIASFLLWKYRQDRKDREEED